MDAQWLDDFRFKSSIIRESDYSDLTDFDVKLKNDWGDKIGIEVGNEFADNAELIVREKVFRKPVIIDIHCNAKVEFHQCIFEDYLQIDSKSGTQGRVDIEATLYRTAIKKGLHFGRWGNYPKINLDCCLLKSLSIIDTKVGTLDLFKCDIFEIYLEGTKMDCLYGRSNFINLFRHNFAKFAEIDIDTASFLRYHKSVEKISPRDFVKLERIAEATKNIEECRSLLGREPPEGRSQEEYTDTLLQNIQGNKKGIRNEKEYARDYFLKFVSLLRESIHESVDAQLISRLNYNFYRYKKQNRAIFATMWLFGFFYRPLRIVLSSVLIISFFGFAFYALGHYQYQFSPVECSATPHCVSGFLTDLADCLYFSGITFYTVGYSDFLEKSISGPLNVVRQIAVLFEAALGIIFTSSIIIALLNKYHVRK